MDESDSKLVKFSVSPGERVTFPVVLTRADSEETLNVREWCHPLRHIAGKMTCIVVCCPSCGQKTELRDPYEIANGTVSPCFGCPACGWSAHLVLAGWGEPTRTLSTP